jgi:predicted RecA/RadA family phage recombinase
MKKTLRAFCVSLPLFGSVWADVTVVQTLDSAMMKGEMVMKVKGDKARTDMPAGMMGSMTVLMDVKSGESVTLMHSAKMMLRMKTGDAMAAGAAAIDSAKIQKPKATGQKEKVGTWETEVFEAETGIGPARMWVAKDFPNYDSIQKELKRISEATTKGKTFDPSNFDMGGMVVKLEMGSPVGKIVTTLVRVETKELDAKDFEVPQGYTEQKLPTIPGLNANPAK